MNAYQASLRFLERYDPRGMVTLADVYDDDEDLRSAICVTFPEFEYPDWSHKSVRALWLYVEGDQ